MFTVEVVMLSYLAGKAPICRFRYCESVPLLLFKRDIYFKKPRKMILLYIWLWNRATKGEDYGKYYI